MQSLEASPAPFFGDQYCQNSWDENVPIDRIDFSPVLNSKSNVLLGFYNNNLPSPPEILLTNCFTFQQQANQIDFNNTLQVLTGFEDAPNSFCLQPPKNYACSKSPRSVSSPMLIGPESRSPFSADSLSVGCGCDSQSADNGDGFWWAATPREEYKFESSARSYQSEQEVYDEILRECEPVVEVSSAIDDEFDQEVDSEVEWQENWQSESPVDKRRKQTQNRQAASRYRSKRKSQLKQLSEQRRQLEQKKAHLLQTVRTLQTKIDNLKSVLEEVLHELD